VSRPFLTRSLVAASLAAVLAGATALPIGAQRAPAGGSQALPDEVAVLKAVRANLERDMTLQARYSYLETRRQMRTDEDGTSRVAQEKVFQVVPDEPEGEVYRRLVRRNGVPLTPKELAEEDAKRQRALRQRAAETPAQRARRLQREEEERREDREQFEEAMRVFDVRLVGVDVLDGRRMLRATLTPREGVRTRTRAGHYLQRFSGEAWVTADDYQLVKIDLTARETINIGWGIIGRIHEGSRATFRRTPVEGGVWLPQRGHLQVSGRAVLVKAVRVDATIEYSDYRRGTAQTHARPSDTVR
jgi:hypothetical protein